MAKYKKKLDADIRCPLEYGLTIFGGKSGEYPQKLYKALMNSKTVLTVWDDARLVGLIRVLDDSEMLAQIHYVLVHPEYQGQGIAGRMVEYIKEKYKNLCILNLCLKTKITFLFMKSMDFMLWKTEQQCRYVILINFL